MDKKDAFQSITDAVVKALQSIKLKPGETCPCCGRKKGSRVMTAKMLEANRRNVKLAQEARRKK